MVEMNGNVKRCAADETVFEWGEDRYHWVEHDGILHGSVPVLEEEGEFEVGNQFEFELSVLPGWASNYWNNVELLRLVT